MSEEREITAAYLGCLLELPRIAEAVSWLESVVELMAGVASGRCRLELYRDPSCLIGEAPKNRKGVSSLAYSLSSTV